MMLFLFIILLLLSGFFSGTEIAYFSLSKPQIRAAVDQKRKNARLVWKLLQKPQRLLITILIGNNIVNVLTASLATVLAVDYFGSFGIGLATGVVTILILIFGEITPKSLAQKNNELLASKTAPILYIMSILFFPIAWGLIRFNNFVAHRLVKKSVAPLDIDDEIKTMARLGVESGNLDYREHAMIEKVLEFDDKTAGDVMTSKYKIVSLNGEVPFDQIAYFVAQSGYSRYPVYEDNEDNIIGYVHVNDIMKKLKSDERDDLLKDNARPLQRIEASFSIERLLRLFVSSQEHIALVIRDEDKNEIIGLVTLEDVLEELVGEIVDETDDEEENGKL